MQHSMEEEYIFLKIVNKYGLDISRTETKGTFGNFMIKENWCMKENI